MMRNSLLPLSLAVIVALVAVLLAPRAEAEKFAVDATAKRALIEIRALRAELADLRTRLESAEATALAAEAAAASWEAIAPYLSLEEMVIDPEGGQEDPRRTVPLLRIHNCNVQIAQGNAESRDPFVENGRGNLLIGEIEDPNAAAWGARTGTSNLIVGGSNDWTGSGGIVHGSGNAIHGYGNVILASDGSSGRGLMNCAAGTFMASVSERWSFVSNVRP